MTRTLMIAMSLFTLTSAAAIAAPATTHHAKAKIVAQAPAGDTTPAPATDKPAKKAKHEKKAKGDAPKSDSKMDSKAPTGAKTPAPETTKVK